MAIVDELIAVLGYDVQGEGNLRRFQSSLDATQKRMTAFAAAAGRIGAVVGTAIGAGLGFLGKSAIETSAQFESYEATLTTIEGSAEKAKAALDWVSDFGRTTPYEVGEITDAFVKLRAYGLDPMDGTMTSLGDTAAAMGKPLNQAVEALADAATGEFERIKEFGVKAKTKGEEVTFSWIENGKAMTKKVKKNGIEITKTLKDIWGKRFSGAMLRQPKTFSGMMSNLGDTWTAFKRKIGDAGFFDTVKNKLGGLLDRLGNWFDDGTADEFAKSLGGMFESTVNALEFLVIRVANNIKFLAGHWGTLGPYVKAFGAALAAMLAFAFPLVSVFLLLALVFDDWVAYMSGGKSVIGDFINWLQKIFPISEGVAQAIAGIGGALSVALTAFGLFKPGMLFRGIGGAISGFGRLLLTGLAALAGPIMSGLASAFALISNPVGWAILLAGVAAGLIYYFWDDIVEGWNKLSGKASELFGQLKTWISSIDWAGTGMAIMNGIFDGIKAIGGEIKAYFMNLVPEWVLKAAGIEVPGEQGSPPAKLTSTEERNERMKTAMGRAYHPTVGNPTYNPDVPAYTGSGSDGATKVGNMNANIAKSSGSAPAASVVTDNSVKTDTRNQSVNPTITINQTVQQTTQAPAAAAQAVGAAVGQAAVAGISRGENAPSF